MGWKGGFKQTHVCSTQNCCTWERHGKNASCTLLPLFCVYSLEGIKHGLFLHHLNNILNSLPVCHQVIRANLSSSLPLLLYKQLQEVQGLCDASSFCGGIVAIPVSNQQFAPSTSPCPSLIFQDLEQLLAFEKMVIYLPFIQNIRQTRGEILSSSQLYSSQFRNMFSENVYGKAV